MKTHSHSRLSPVSSLPPPSRPLNSLPSVVKTPLDLALEFRPGVQLLSSHAIQDQEIKSRTREAVGGHLISWENFWLVNKTGSQGQGAGVWQSWQGWPPSPSDSSAWREQGLESHTTGCETSYSLAGWTLTTPPPTLCLSFFISKSRITVLLPKEAEFKHAKYHTSPSPRPSYLATESSFSKSQSLFLFCK